MSESDYTVVSNISRYGMAPVEAGAYIKTNKKRPVVCSGQQAFFYFL